MAKKRRTKAEIEADRQKVQAEFVREYEEFKKTHPPEECSCVEHCFDTVPVDVSGIDYRDISEANIERINRIGNSGLFHDPFRQKKLDDIRRMQEAGITEYGWVVSENEQCPRCLSYKGQIFRCDTPPPGGHPGIAPGCWCIAVPKIHFETDAPQTVSVPKRSMWKKIFGL